MLVTKAKQEIGESFCWKPEDIFEKSIKKKKKIQISLQSLECMRQFICFCGLDVKVDLRDNVWIELLNIHVLKQQTALPSSFTIHSENRNLA